MSRISKRKGPRKPSHSVQGNLPEVDLFNQPHLSNRTKALLEPHARTISQRAKLSQQEAKEHEEIVASMIRDGCKPGQCAYLPNESRIELVLTPEKIEGKYIPKKEKKAKKGKSEETEE